MLKPTPPASDGARSFGTGAGLSPASRGAEGSSEASEEPVRLMAEDRDDLKELILKGRRA